MNNKLFEKWITKQFTSDVGALFYKDADGSYSDEMTNAMFIAFCAGRVLA